MIPGEHGLPTADTSGFEPGSRPAQYYDESADELNGATADVDTITSGLIADTSSQLAGSIGELNSLYDELIGSTDVMLTDGGLPLFKLVDKLYKDTAKTIGGAIGELMVNGFQVPPTTADMVAHTDADFIQLVASAVPALAPHLGVEPIEPLPTVYSAPQPAPQPTTDDSFYAPLPYGPPPPATQQQGADPTCCPSPVNVTVNVPPIVFPPYPGADAQVQPGTPGTYYQSSPGSSASATVQPQPGAPFQIVPFANPGVPPPPPAGPSFAGSTPSSLLFPISGLDLKATNELAINWGDVGGCDRAEEITKKYEGVVGTLPEPDLANPIKSYVESSFGLGAWAKIHPRLAAANDKFQSITDVFSKTAELYAKSALATIDNLSSAAVLSTIAPQNVPNPVTAAAFSAKLAAANRAEKATGAPMMYLTTGDMYGLQYSNPQFLPNQIRTDNAFLANTINEHTWTCWTRANGNLPEPARRVMNADQLKPNLSDLFTLYRRGNLKKEDLPKRARELGVLEPAYLPEWLEATKQLPTQSDLIRFMVRDAADEQVVKKYGLDTDFEKKFPGQMQKWATALGLDTEYFKYQWRVHWNIPSYTQLTEMLTRLRRDRLEVKQWEAINGPWAPDPVGKPTPGKPRVVTLDDVKQALEINDMSPGWINELVAVAYTPINRTDAIRAYMSGVFSDAQLLDSFQSTGYSPRDAQIMLDFYQKDKARRNRNISGTWSPRKVVRYYKASTISRAAAANLLKPVMPNAAMINDVLDGADAELAADERQVQLRRVKRAYMLGEWAERDVTDAFTWLELDAGQQAHLLKVWYAEREGRMKQPTVAQLSKWVNLGIVTIEEAERRLMNLGYAKIDADRILAAALKWDFGGAPPTAEELSDNVQEVIRNQKVARKKADTSLAARLRQIVDEAARIVSEINRRRVDAGLTPIPSPVIP